MIMTNPPLKHQHPLRVIYAMRVPRAVHIAALSSCSSVPTCCRALAFCVSSRLPCQRRQNHNMLSQHSSNTRSRSQRKTKVTTRMAFDPDVTPSILDAFHGWLTKSGVKLGDNVVLAGRSPLGGKQGLVTTKVNV